MDAKSPQLAAICYQRGFDVDGLLLRVCRELRPLGVGLGGVIQQSSGSRGQCAASVHLLDLRSGEAFDIWQARGAYARGCRLDERGLLDAEATILATIAEGVDLIVINRFGRAESLGRGLTSCFAAALGAGVPVLTAVRHPYDHAWREFHGGLGQALSADTTQIVGWAMRATRRSDASSPGAAAIAAG